MRGHISAQKPDWLNGREHFVWDRLVREFTFQRISPVTLGKLECLPNWDASPFDCWIMCSFPGCRSIGDWLMYISDVIDFQRRKVKRSGDKKEDESKIKNTP
jgi:hypothetical protein